MAFVRQSITSLLTYLLTYLLIVYAVGGVCVCVCGTLSELEVRLMTEHAPLSTLSDIRTLRTLRSTCIIEAFNLQAAVHYQHHDCMCEGL